MEFLVIITVCKYIIISLSFFLTLSLYVCVYTHTHKHTYLYYIYVYMYTYTHMYVYVLLLIEPRVSCMLGKLSTTELQPQPQVLNRGNSLLREIVFNSLRTFLLHRWLSEASTVPATSLNTGCPHL